MVAGVIGRASQPIALHELLYPLVFAQRDKTLSVGLVTGLLANGTR